MKTRAAFLALALVITSVAFADQAPSVTAVQSAPENSPEPSLADLLSAPRPVNRSTTCEEQVYQDCLWMCYELSQTNRCDFYASQACLCMRAPADCPLCY